MHLDYTKYGPPVLFWHVYTHFMMICDLALIESCFLIKYEKTVPV